MTAVDDAALVAQWESVWPRALAAWSPYTQLRSPTFLLDAAAARALSMDEEIAAIRLVDQKVMVNVQTLRRKGLEDHALAILAHEIGHHVYVPGNLSDNGRMLAAMRRMLPGLPARVVGICSNLYGDLMINDRLQRRAGVDIAAVYEILAQGQGAGAISEVWQVYLRTYEELWHREGQLVSGPATPNVAQDALLLARLVRSFAGDWLMGAQRFAAVMYPYFAAESDQRISEVFVTMGLNDLRDANASPDGPGSEQAIPDGLAEIEESETDGALEGKPPSSRTRNQPAQGNFREPFEYGALLKDMGLRLSAEEITARYYRERALPHLLPFPARRAPRATEPLAEGYEDWSAGDALEEMDTLESVTRSPVLIPGVTTVRRVYGETPGSDPARVPMDLDLYVDCSGSMPDPSSVTSYLALAGTILALSALRAGARVQATLWSGPGQFRTSEGFIRDEKTLMGIITGYIAGSTAFPLHVLRETYRTRPPSDPPAHLVVISDDGADTLLSDDERGTPGADLCRAALARARGGGTLVLNLGLGAWPAWKEMEGLGFDVFRVSAWEDLVRFAHAFVRKNYQER